MNKAKKKIPSGEFLVPAIMAITVAIFLYQSIDIPRPEDNLRLVWVVIGILCLSLIVIVASLFRGGGVTDKESSKPRDYALFKRQGTLYGLVVLYLVIMNHLGFILTSVVMLPLMFLASGVKKYKEITLISLFVPFLTYVVFRRFFNILLPEGFIEEYLVNNVLYWIH